MTTARFALLARSLRALCALSARKAPALRWACLLVVSCSLHAALNAQTPDFKGQYGSNKPAMAEDLASPAPKDAGEPWSHYLNPLAHPGVAGHLGLMSGEGGAGRTYGETVIDGYSLTPIPGPVPKAAYDSGWSTKTWAVNATFTYKRRRVTLKSGASLVIFKPMETPPDPDDCGPSDNGVYDRDALFVSVGYQGRGFELVKKPPAWSSDGGYVDPYSNTDVPFGYEIDLVSNFDSGLNDVFWIRQGSVEWEALERGMTLVFVHPSLGQRPLVTHLAQFIEAAKWLDSCRYANSCMQFPPPATTYRHRNFISGGSYNGGVARIAATYLPWVFRGAVSIAGAVDMHATFAWQEAYEFLQRQVLGVYLGGFSHVPDLMDADVLSLFQDLRRGYAGSSALPIAGVPVDVAGAGLIVWDLPSPLFSNTELIVPLVLVHGDDDHSQYSFFGRDLETELALGVSSFTGTTCSSNNVSYTGVVVERRVPNECHTDIIHWNQEQHLTLGRGLLDLLLAQMVDQPREPIPFASSNPTLDIEWSARAVDPAAPSANPHLARVFRDELLLPKIDELPEAVFGSGLLCSHVTDVVDIAGLPQTSEWPELREVCEGLGLPDSLVVADVDADPDVELIAGTARGDVVKLRFVTDTSDVVQSVDFLWRRRVSDYPSDPELAAATDYFGPSEVMLDGDEVLVAHSFGPVWKIDVTADTNPAASLVLDNEPLAADDYNLGTWLRSLRKSGSTFSLINDEGELLSFDGDGGSFARSFLEGGAGPVLPLGSGTYLYASAHGNVKRTDGATPAHPTMPANLSEHLYGIPHILLNLSSPIGDGQFLAWTKRYLVLLADDLSIVGDPAELGSPQGLHETGSGPTGDGRLVGFWSKIPTELLETGESASVRTPVVAGISVTESATSFKGYVRLPAPVAALARFPGGGKLAQPGGPGPDFLARWVATLQTGQVALIGEVSSFAGDVTDTQLALFREPYGSAFGMVTLDQPSASIRVTTAGSRAWLLDVAADDDVVQGSVTNSFHPGFRLPWAPFRGAVEVGGNVYGLPDGGDRYQAGPLVAMPFASPYRQADVLAGMEDPLEFEAGMMVVDVTENQLVFGAFTNVQNALLCSTYIDLGLCNYDIAGSVKWKSTPLTSHTMVGSVESTGFILTGFGNACRWADLDGDGTEDLVAATHGGRLVWFENASVGAIPDLPTDPTGEAAYVAANEPGDPLPLGWEGDLGSTMMAMETTDLDGDGDDEVLVGTFLDVDPSHPEHFRLAGSVYAFERGSGDALDLLDQLELDYGVCGLQRIPYSGAGAGIHYFVAGTARGRVYVLQYNHNASPTERLQPVYRSAFTAPMAGAYDALRAFAMPDASGRRFRVVFGSSGGVFAFDIVLPETFSPGDEASCQ